MSPNVEKVLTVARKELGIREEPMGSNTGRRVREYQSHTFLGGTRWPWCAALCHAVFDWAGFPFPYKSASAFGMLDWARRAGWARSRPEPGSLGVVSAGAGHINIVERVRGSYVDCIDGNSSDRVQRTTRHISAFRGFIRHPALDGAHRPVKAPVPAPPRFEIVTSEKGTAKVVAVGPRPAIAKRAAAGMANWLRLGKAVTVRRARPKKARR